MSDLHLRDEVMLFRNRDEANKVLKVMKEVIQQYAIVSVEDLNTLVGIPSRHEDSKCGWTSLDKTKVRKVRRQNLYAIKFPPLESIKEET